MFKHIISKTWRKPVQVSEPRPLPKQPPKSQSRSPFFQLPAELRNKIYTHYFDNLACSESHSLSLLLTCRGVYTEAHILAFSMITFATTSWARDKLVSLSSVLRPESFNAITSMAFVYFPDENPTISVPHRSWENSRIAIPERRMSTFIANAATVFPNIRRLTLILPKSYSETDQEEPDQDSWDYFCEKGLVTAAGPTYLRWSFGYYCKTVWPEDEEEPFEYCILLYRPLFLSDLFPRPREVRISWLSDRMPGQEPTWLRMCTPRRPLVRRDLVLYNAMLSPAIALTWMGRRMKTIWKAALRKMSGM
ncbi:hypothetical protein BU16DRAFT_44785 [Lophium mytilinum]|uniref:Uncharacterized protein n=1 Tax=Lophium mytilinum TaxID=390894 RepID=A0A6A6QRM9_9PEZI|nr:hypothetical protein BU16DRAFT_44785 [Lophium mytilinum]